MRGHHTRAIQAASIRGGFDGSNQAAALETNAMARMNKLSTYATKIAKIGEETIITYHRTDIVRFDGEMIALNFGGWDTVTTRRKMNQAAAQFCLPFSVYRKAGETFIECRVTGETIQYTGHAITIQRKAA